MPYRPKTVTPYDYELYPPTQVVRPHICYPVVGDKSKSDPGSNCSFYKGLTSDLIPIVVHRTKTGVGGGTDWTAYFSGNMPPSPKQLILVNLYPGILGYYQVWMFYLYLYTSYNSYRIGYQVNTFTGDIWYFSSAGTWVVPPFSYGPGVYSRDIRIGLELDLSTGKIIAFHANESRYEPTTPPSIYVEGGSNPSWRWVGYFYIRTSTAGYQHTIGWGPIEFYPLE